jgi:hypothetical protein
MTIGSSKPNPMPKGAKKAPESQHGSGWYLATLPISPDASHANQPDEKPTARLDRSRGAEHPEFAAA